MKRIKFFIGLGSFLLAIGGVLATKANKKCSHPLIGKFFMGFAATATLSSLPASFTTTIHANHTVFLATSCGKISTLKTTLGMRLIYAL